MCGIFGIVNYTEDERERFSRCLNLLTHRGPDDSGIYSSPSVLLGHRRLSIIDLDTGHQPITSEDQNYTIIYNGECYNFKELRDELSELGYEFRTRTDTEVVLNGYIEFGTEIFKRINGMFGLAIWDEKNQELILARDRMGMKPLYYSWFNSRFVFSSEVNVLVEMFPELKVLNKNSLFQYLVMQSVPAPFSIYKNISKLTPGEYLILKKGKVPRLEKYDTLNFNYKQSFSNESEVISEFWERIEEGVERRLISDVPLGVFLSGGLDSTVIVSALHRLGKDKIKTFSVGFKDHPKSELPYARKVAERFKTEHNEITLEPFSIDILNTLVTHFGEPYADTSAIPTYFISRAVSDSIKVVLGGDGGDEMMCGYSTYAQINKAFRYNLLLLPFLPYLWLGTKLNLNENLNRKLRQMYFTAHRKERIYPLSRTYYFTKLNRRILSDGFYLSGLTEPFELLHKFIKNNQDVREPLDKVFLTDIVFPLANTLLPKVDITGMANSIEIRAPFLDKLFVDFSLSLNPKLKLKNNQPKYITKKALEEYFPNEFIYRPKQGFTPPIKIWLRNQNKDFMDELLSEKMINAHGLFKYKQVKKLRDEFIDEQYDHSPYLWNLINFQLWYNHYKPSI